MSGVISFANVSRIIISPLLPHAVTPRSFFPNVQISFPADLMSSGAFPRATLSAIYCVLMANSSFSLSGELEV